MSSLALGLKILADAQLTPPVVGYEMTNAKGQVVADAELAWPTKQLVVLRADQDDLVSIWNAATWQVVLLDEDGLNVQTQDWHSVVLAKLSV
jgi:DEAD/DEAH box helicase domain-containing protein